jgi:heptose I phosphotransferase
MNVGAGKIDIIKLPHMVMNRDYLALLETGGLLDFDGIYNYQGGTVLKRIRDRSVLRMEIPDGDKHRIFYLKRHNPVRPGIKEMIGSLLSQGGSSPGMAEFTTLCQLREHGIPTAAPVAAGEKGAGGGRFESFLLTESFTPYISLEEIILNHPESLKGADGRIRKERLIKTIASLARTLHNQGVNHCDFNATHILVSPEKDNGWFDLALFDLQRIDRKKWLRLKWFIKTMAQLNFTMPDPLFDDRDRLLLFRTYKGSSGMQLMDRFQLYWIRKKVQKISRHTEKINIRREKNRGV